VSREVDIVAVPDSLGGSVGDVEALHALVEGRRPAERFILDMGRVGFVKPYGVVALLLTARRLCDLSGRRVELANIGRQVHSYLERMDLFEVGGDWLAPARGLDEGWDRNPQTPNLLELTVIEGPQDVVTAVSRAERVFSRWLDVPDLHGLLRVMSELCANVYQHSGDLAGCVMIQKYEATARGRTVVSVAVGDLGCGVRASLAARHGEMGHEPLDYLREAMGGRTSRANGRGGLGLRVVEEAAKASGGRLWLRSETAAVVSRASGQACDHRELCHVPGTQVAVELSATLDA
jgi:anti-sigma regulatory factor (Ser/Thr protein kinase)